MHPRKGDGIIESLVLVKLSAKQQKQHNYSQFFPLYPSNAQLLSYLRTDCFTWLKKCNTNCTHNCNTSCSCNRNSNMFNAQAQKWLNSKRSQSKRRWWWWWRWRRRRRIERRKSGKMQSKRRIDRKRYRWRKGFPCSLFPIPSHSHISLSLSAYLSHTHTHTHTRPARIAKLM